MGTLATFTKRLRPVAPTILMAGLICRAAAGPIPRLQLETTSGKHIEVETAGAPATVVLFLSSVCPMSGDYAERIAELHSRYTPRRVRFVLINANEHESNQDVERHAKLSALPQSVLRDPQATIADLLGVTATPTTVVLDTTAQVRYWGAIDDSRNPQRVRNRYLAGALESLLLGKNPDVPRTKTMGCSIKNGSR